MLELVIGALHTWRGPQWRLQGLRAAKFLSPLRPDETFEIVLSMTDSRLDWRCERDARVLAQGSCEMTA